MQQQFANGATVYDTTGEKIGSLREYNQQDGYIMVEKGWLFPKDFYVPLTAVQGTDDNGDILLSLHKDDLQGDLFDSPPVEGTTGIGSYGQTAATTETTRVPAQSMPSSATTQTGSEEIVMPVREEELVVGKRQQEEGRVHIHKDVVTEQESIPVTLHQERVTVERVPVTGQADVDTTDAFQERDIDVPVMGEEAVVGKQVRVSEEVRLHKDVVTEQQQVSGTTRREDVTVDANPEDLIQVNDRRGQ